MSAAASDRDLPALRLRVDLADRTGPFRGAATGVLYGLSDEGVPSDNAVEPLRIATVAQKAPGGLQHPNGDALEVADQFFRTGGDYIQVYVQDVYREWPYEDLGLDDYLDQLARVVTEVSGCEHADRMAYVPFNEPDEIWYGLDADDRADYEQGMRRFLDHWRIAVGYIREHHRGASIVGMNDARFRQRNYRDFLTFALEHDVLPDIVAWHQLSPGSLDPDSSSYYRDNFARYRRIEADLGIEPRTININEYAENRDLTVPGRLVQWVTMLEETKVDAGGQAYWTAAGSLAGNVVETNKPGGAWWFCKMYADMRGGDSIRVTSPPRTGVDSLEGLATIDDVRRQARIVAGGTSEPFDVVIADIDPAVFGGHVHVTVTGTTWSGQDADAPPPVVLHEGDHVAEHGSLTVPVRGMGVHGDGGVNHDRMAAYEIVLSPGGPHERDRIVLPWRGSYEAESATVVGGVVNTLGGEGDALAPAASGMRDVGSLNQPHSSVRFEVDVPHGGRYTLGILYGNQTGMPAQQVLTINGARPTVVDYPATMSWTSRGRIDAVVHLEPGRNAVELAASHPGVRTLAGEVTLDRIDLVSASAGPGARVYAPEHAQTRGQVVHRYDPAEQSGAGCLELQEDAEAMFVLYAEEDAYFDVSIRHSSPGRPPGEVTGRLSLDARSVRAATLSAEPDASWGCQTRRLFLAAGVNRLVVSPAGPTPLRLGQVSVQRATSGPRPVQVFEVDDAMLSGSAVVRSGPQAPHGRYVDAVGLGPEHRVELDVEVADGGEHRLVVAYANDHRETGHPYNTDIVSRPLDVSVDDGEPTRYWFRNTWSWGNVWTRVLPVRLRAGRNRIAMYVDPANGRPMDVGSAPHLHGFAVARVHVPPGGRSGSSERPRSGPDTRVR